MSLGVLAFLTLGGGQVPAAQSQPERGILATSPEPGWPQWRGPRRDGICDETGLLQSWPAEGPRVLWQSGDLGRGYSAAIITGSRIYLAGDVEDELKVFALDLQGARMWTATNGRSWKGPYPGARAACTYRDGRLFHLNAHGRLACLEAATGKELWHVEVLAQFGGKNIQWALSECVLVDGSRVIVTAGGSKALMAALDVRTGQPIWTTEPLTLGPSSRPEMERVPEPPGEPDSPGYSSPILYELGGRRHIVNCSMRHLFGVDADTGRLLWTRPMRTLYSVIAATPVLVGDAVFATAPDTRDTGLYRPVTASGTQSVQKLWSSNLDTCHGGLVLVDDALYGSWYRNGKGWASLDAATGQLRHTTNALAKGAVLWADQRLYCTSEEGEAALIRPGPASFGFAGRFKFAPGRVNDAWTHPVIHDRKLYLRFHATLSCYDIRAPRP